SGHSGDTGPARVSLDGTNSALKGSTTLLGAARSGESGDTGETGDASARGDASSNANSGAQSAADSLSGDTGNAANRLRVRLTGGAGGAAGGGDDRIHKPESNAVDPADTITSTSNNGGSGGDVRAS